MSPLLGNQEYNLTLSWQNVAVKVKRTNVVHDSTRTWLRKFVSWKKAEEVTILDNGELKQTRLLIFYSLPLSFLQQGGQYCCCADWCNSNIRCAGFNFQPHFGYPHRFVAVLICLSRWILECHLQIGFYYLLSDDYPLIVHDYLVKTALLNNLTFIQWTLWRRLSSGFCTMNMIWRFCNE